MSKSGKKSITLKLYFWNIEKKKGWASGTIALESNKYHEIRSDTKIFNSLEEFMIKLHEILNDNDISLVMADEEGGIVPRLGKGYPLKAGPWRT